ncbi:unnamed protein product [Soboliphyme baturini]|uniref:Uncharacterized protein n=1 Tax=Soboliphyme baturini TaxID=241478 RepID=A0A183IC13_9BILA|nr:unnamed protein product [Soboliphyme baturini]
MIFYTCDVGCLVRNISQRCTHQQQQQQQQQQLQRASGARTSLLFTYQPTPFPPTYLPTDRTTYQSTVRQQVYSQSKEKGTHGNGNGNTIVYVCSFADADGFGDSAGIAKVSALAS